MSDKKPEKKADKPKKKAPPASLKPVNMPEFPGAPKPTVFEGGLERMIQIWNDLRAINTSAYGSGVCGGVSGWGIGHQDQTACSPFTAGVIGILFDPNGTVKGKCNPVYDGGTKPLPKDFYIMHQGNFSGKLPKGVSNGMVNSSANSILYYNLGYEIRPKDLRRGDMVGIDWHPHGGHAVFIWDVHLNAKQECDAFCFVSANGSIIPIYDPNDPPKDPKNPRISAATNKPRKQIGRKLFGEGISIGGCQGKKYFSGAEDVWKISQELRKNDNIQPKMKLFTDRPDHILDANWYAPMGSSWSDIDFTTWKEINQDKPPSVLDYTCKRYAGSMRCVRFWGFPPPDRDGETPHETADFVKAKDLAKYPMPPSYVTGTGKAPAVTLEKQAPSTTKGDAEKIKDAPAKKAEQPKQPDKITTQQEWVEKALEKLHKHGWLDHDPGDPTNYNDAETKAAIKEYQEKFKYTPVDGIATKKLRDHMQGTIDDLDAGAENPNKKPPPAPKSKLDRVVWMQNRIQVGEPLYFAMHGVVHAIEQVKITFTCRKTKKSKTIPCDVDLDALGVIQQPIGVPDIFEDGNELLASFSGTAKDGAAIKFDSKVPLYIGPPIIAMMLE